ncbi:hypothetical protein D7N47_17300 [Salmonella enterica subsp. enterica]|uniref:Lipoprotein n=2 Tax=Salmonella enterica TaxID=28901 RepID=A0A760NIR4_SALER|nr:hypothetical protein [Salmonella enterica subsp. enterica serovar Richmond]EAU4931019.1 hypothetical protein [Salmonella enterica]EBF9679124.1 hypothetical protein [Salmonella enterica subsp. enterica serovar Glostrup]ECD4289018.1 hypothetical protein [Salmonella enterica subsp. enterica serovar Potsdam]ECI7967257.1 hypothetical protein [Salmonella enterica subsp. enterica]EDJ0842879.1 hypothetical protein [Salmonella enterica subsp. enterica serovar Tshiongwe]EEG3121342.1 hypothetical pro
MMNRLTPCSLAVAVLLLAGCGAVPKSGGITAKAVSPAAPAAGSRVNIKQAVTAQEAAPVTTGTEACDRELKALKKLDARRYALRRAQFNRLMSGAAVYAGIRTDVAGGTRQAVDAMYLFRTGKLCTDISRDVMDALARQGDSITDGHN